MQEDKFAAVEREVGVAVKNEMTILQKWPYRPRLRPDEEGAMQEFSMLLGLCLTGTERYVEWSRAD